MLPKIEHPLFKVKIPSTGKDIMMRPMLVKEEKILLMAKEGNDYGEKMLAIKQVLNNCIQKVQIDELTTFDIEYLFLKLRSISIESVIKLRITDEEDSKEREIEVNLDDVEIDFSNAPDKVIQMGTGKGIQLRYPTTKVYEHTKNIENNEDLLELLAISTLDKYFDGEEVYDLTKETTENLKKFLEEQITAKTYYDIRAFLEKIPSLKYEIKYTNDSGKEVVITLSSLNDFFIF